MDTKFEKWCLTPLPTVGRDCVVFRIKPKAAESMLAAVDDIIILVHKDKCKLISPIKKELEMLNSNWKSPSQLLISLAKAGINLIFEYETDTENCIKNIELEKHAYDGLSLISLMSPIASSKWNSHETVKKDVAVFRVHQSLVDQTTISAELDRNNIDSNKIVDYTTQLEEDIDEKWDLYKYQRTKCGPIRRDQPATAEDETTFVDLSTLEGFITHNQILSNLEDKHQDKEKIHNLLESSNVLTIFTVKTLLNSIRPLRF